MHGDDHLHRLVVVEDEWIALRGLTETVDWERFGFRLVGFHRNGRECLDALATDAPDVIITDIRMPVMDGLTLLREIRSRRDDLTVILLSGHEEFEFARQGLQDGAACYLLKASIEADMEEYLPEIERRLTLAREQARTSTLEQDRVHSLARAEALRQILAGISTAPDAAAKAALAPDLEAMGRSHAVIAIRVSATGAAESDAKVLAEVDGLLRRLAAPGEVESIATAPQEFAVVISALEKASVLFDSSVRAFAGRLERMLNDLCADRPLCGMAIGVGSRVSGIAAIRGSLDDARRATDLQSPRQRVCIGGRRQALLRSEAQLADTERDDAVVVYLLEKESLTSAVLSVDREAIATRLSDFRVRIDAIPAVSLNRLRGEVEEFVGSLYRRLDQWRPEVGLLLSPVHQVFESITAIATVALLTDEFDRIVWFVADCVARIQKTPAIRGILAAVRYMESHLEESPKLAEVAGHAGISPAHFSVIFKQAMGVTFSDYLTDLRLERGRELLKRGVGVRQASEMVGYSDVRHFRRLFKRRFGVTPRQIE